MLPHRPRIPVEGGGHCGAVIDLSIPADEREPAAPIVLAVWTGGQLSFWCEWCVRPHYHGGTGHRVAHCINPASPYRRTGYEIRECGDPMAARRWPRARKVS